MNIGDRVDSVGVYGNGNGTPGVIVAVDGDNYGVRWDDGFDDEGETYSEDELLLIVEGGLKVGDTVKDRSIRIGANEHATGVVVTAVVVDGELGYRVKWDDYVIDATSYSENELQLVEPRS